MTHYQPPEGSDLAVLAAAEQDAMDRAELARIARVTACDEFREAQAVYDLASETETQAIEAWAAARRAHVEAMRAVRVAQTADGYVTR